MWIEAGYNTTPSVNDTVTYTGLNIQGGSGTDTIYNGANSGVVTDGGGKGDFVQIDGSNASATVGGGAGDVVWVGEAAVGTGTALGGSTSFGAGASADLVLWYGAELAAPVANTTAATQTAMSGATTGSLIDFSNIGGLATTNVSNYTLQASDTTFALAENSAINAGVNGGLGGANGIVSFTFSGNEYIVAHQGGAGVVAGDSVVELVGVTNHTISLFNFTGGQVQVG